MTRAGAVFLGVLAGATTCIVALILGWILYQRLFGDSLPALLVIGFVTIATGGYGGWLLGWLIFSGLRSSGGPSGGELP